MKTEIPASYYHQNEIYLKEKSFLLNSIWQYAGLTDKLKNPQDYLCATIAGKSVIIMNFNGNLRAFHNVCSHRLSRILAKEEGNGFLQCQYHGWTYDENGIPYAIPNKKCFSSLEPEKMKLATFPVATCGRFVFVCLGEKKQGLPEFLGSMQAVLEEISEALGEQIDYNCMEIQANWKIVVENTLEDYHVRAVHPTSLNKLGIHDRSYHYANPHSSTRLKFNTKLTDHSYVAKAYEHRVLAIEDYDHYLIFPNLTIASAYGTTISIQQVIPLSSQRTCFISRVYGTQFKSKPQNTAVIKAFHQSAIEFNRQVFAEDKLFCEQVQKGVEEATQEYGFLCHDEQRVHAFHEAYNKLMNEKAL